MDAFSLFFIAFRGAVVGVKVEIDRQYPKYVHKCNAMYNQNIQMRFGISWAFSALFTK